MNKRQADNIITVTTGGNIDFTVKKNILAITTITKINATSSNVLMRGFLFIL